MRAGACLAVLGLLLALAACTLGEATPTAVPTPSGTPTSMAGLTVVATRTPQQVRPTPTPPPTVTPTPAAVVFDLTGSGGAVCHAAGGGPEQCSPARLQGGAAAGDRITANAAPDGTLGLSTQLVKLRLLAGSAIRLKKRSDLSAPETFILQAGQVLFDHENSAGEIVVEVGALRIQPVDTKFVVEVGPGGKAVVGVFGPGRVLISGPTSAEPPVAAIADNEQFDYSPPAPTPGPGTPFPPPGTATPSVVPLHPLDPDLRALWTTYGVVAPEPTDTPVPTPTSTPTPADVTPPAISAVRAVPTTVGYGQCGGQNTTVQISATVRDPAGVSEVDVVYNYASARPGALPGPAHALRMQLPAVGVSRLPVYSAQIDVGREAPAELQGAQGTVVYYIVAVDKLGNKGTGGKGTVQVNFCIG